MQTILRQNPIADICMFGVWLFWFFLYEYFSSLHHFPSDISSRLYWTSHVFGLLFLPNPPRQAPPPSGDNNKFHPRVLWYAYQWYISPLDYGYCWVFVSSFLLMPTILPRIGVRTEWLPCRSILFSFEIDCESSVKVRPVCTIHLHLLVAGLLAPSFIIVRWSLSFIYIARKTAKIIEEDIIILWNKCFTTHNTQLAHNTH